MPAPIARAAREAAESAYEIGRALYASEKARGEDLASHVELFLVIGDRAALEQALARYRGKD